LLIEWDAAVTEESAAAALYELWLREVEPAVFHRLAPESVWKLFDGRWPSVLVMQHLLKPDVNTFGSNPEAGRDHLLLDAIQPAVEKLSKLEGADPGGWQWRKIYHVRFRHALDRMPGAGPLLDLGPLARPGDNSTVNAAYFGFHWEQVAGASYREIMDTSSLGPLRRRQRPRRKQASPVAPTARTGCRCGPRAGTSRWSTPKPR
jgi:penicillin G amidase